MRHPRQPLATKPVARWCLQCDVAGGMPATNECALSHRREHDAGESLVDQGAPICQHGKNMISSILNRLGYISKQEHEAHCVMMADEVARLDRVRDEWRTVAKTKAELHEEAMRRVQAQAAVIASQDAQLQHKDQEFRRVSLQLAEQSAECRRLRAEIESLSSDKQTSMPLVPVDQMTTVRKYLQRLDQNLQPSLSMLRIISRRASVAPRLAGLEPGISRLRDIDYGSNLYLESIIAKACEGVLN